MTTSSKPPSSRLPGKSSEDSGRDRPWVAVENLRTAVLLFDARLRDAAPAALAQPSPCEGWSGADVVAHVARNLVGLVDALGGGDYRAAPDPAVSVEAAGWSEAAGSDLREVWATASRNALDAFDALDALAAGGGAAIRPDTEVRIGPTLASVEFLLVALVRDVTVHVWDLVRAVGGNDRLPADLVRVVLADMPAITSQMRASGRYGEILTIPDGADEQDRLLALVGRRRTG